MPVLNVDTLKLESSSGAPIALIPAWISKHMSSKLWDEITYPFQNFNGYTVEISERISNFITNYIMDVIIQSV